MTSNKKPVTNDVGFLSEYAGVGLEDMKGSAVSIPYLTMVQPGSQATLDGCPAGHWRNSATGEDYGEQIELVVLDFKMIWAERSDDPNQLTVARYMPNSIPVEYRQPPKGKRGFPKMINPDSGNEIQEQFMYVVALPEHPEAGYLLFNPAVGNMKVCRSWNSRMQGQLIEGPNGAVKAPAFASVWIVGLQLVPNPQKPADKIARFVVVDRKGFIEEGMFTEMVKPMLEAAKGEIQALTSANEQPAIE